PLVSADGPLRTADRADGPAPFLDPDLPGLPVALDPDARRVLRERRRRPRGDPGPPDRVRVGLAGHRDRRLRGGGARAVGAGPGGWGPQRARAVGRADRGGPHDHGGEAAGLATGVRRTRAALRAPRRRG